MHGVGRGKSRRYSQILTYRHNGGSPANRTVFELDTIVVDGITVDSVITEEDSMGYGTDIIVRFTNNIDEARSNIGYDSINHGADALTVEGYDVLGVNAVGNSLFISIRPQLNNPNTPPQGTRVTLNSTLYDVYGQTITDLSSQVNGKFSLIGDGSQTLSQGASLTPIVFTMDSTTNMYDFDSWVRLYDSSWNQLSLSTIFESLTIEISNQSVVKTYTLTQEDLDSLNLHTISDINFDLYEDLQGTVTITGKLKTNAPIGDYSLKYTLFTNCGSSSLGNSVIYSNIIVQ